MDTVLLISRPLGFDTDCGRGGGGWGEGTEKNQREKKRPPPALSSLGAGGDEECLGTQPDISATRCQSIHQNPQTSNSRFFWYPKAARPRQPCLLPALVFLAVDILGRNAKNHGVVLYLIKGLCARERHRQGSIRPKASRKMDMGAGWAKGREIEGWRAEGQQIHQALLSLAGGELERTKEREREAGMTAAIMPALHRKSLFLPARFKYLALYAFM